MELSANTQKVNPASANPIAPKSETFAPFISLSTYRNDNPARPLHNVENPETSE
jgi:hypothetical protein